MIVSVTKQQEKVISPYSGLGLNSSASVCAPNSVKQSLALFINKLSTCRTGKIYILYQLPNLFKFLHSQFLLQFYLNIYFSCYFFLFLFFLSRLLLVALNQNVKYMLKNQIFWPYNVLFIKSNWRFVMSLLNKFLNWILQKLSFFTLFLNFPICCCRALIFSLADFKRHIFLWCWVQLRHSYDLWLVLCKVILNCLIDAAPLWGLFIIVISGSTLASELQ